MANVLERYMTRRRNRSSNSSEDSNNSPEKKKAKNQAQNCSVEEEEDDDILKALIMSENVSRQLEQILEKLKKLDSIETALENIEAKLENLESRTKWLEEVQHGNEHEILVSVLKDSLSKNESNLKDVTAKQTASEKELANFTCQVKNLEKKTEDLHTKNLYLEAYSRRENLKFMNVKETATVDQREDTEQVLRGFLERELGFLNARDVEIQRVHRVGERKDEKSRPILVRFLRYQDCAKLLALGRRLRGIGYQMFRDLPSEIVDR